MPRLADTMPAAASLEFPLPYPQTCHRAAAASADCDFRKWPKAEIEMPSEPVRVAQDLAEVFTSATPATRDVILVGGMVGNRPCFLVAK